MAEDEIGKILDLLRLAEDARTPANEAQAAKRAAVRRIQKAGLTREALRKERRRKERDEGVRREPGFGPGTIVIGDNMLIVTDHGHAYRIAVIHPSRRGASSHFIMLPKRYVLNILYLSTEEKEAIGWSSRDVITRAVVLDEAYLQDSIHNGWRTWY